MTRQPALLVLADGEVFEGEAAGLVQPVSTGELVFNTACQGYQEVVTDPSYAGQVIAFTYPHIGNYGTNAARRRGAAAVLPRRRRPGPDDGAEQLAGHRGARGVPRPPRRPRRSPASTPAG